MKWLNRKSIALLVAVIMIGTLLAGCGGKTETKKDEPKKVEVVIWEQDDEVVDKVFDEQAKAFMAKFPNITITRAHYTTEDLRSNFQTAALGGQGPHIVYGPDDNIGVFATAGIIQPLDTWFGRAVTDALDENALNGNRFDGKLWGLPDRIGNHLTLVYNKKLVPEAPKDFDALIKLAKDLTKDTNKDGKIDQYGLAYNLNEPFWLIPFYGGFGGAVMDDKNFPTLNNEAMVGALQFVYDLKFTQKIVPPDADYNVMDTLFKEGKAAMIINGPWSWAGYQQAGIDIGLAPIPMINSTGKWPAPYTSTKSYMVSSIVKDEATRDAVKKVMAYFMEKDVQLALMAAHKQNPTNIEAAGSDAVKNDPILQASAAQLANGTPMPIVPQMRAVWDAIRPNLELVMSGKMKPADAAKAMQELAEQKVKEIK